MTTDLRPRLEGVVPGSWRGGLALATFEIEVKRGERSGGGGKRGKAGRKKTGLRAEVDV